MILHVRISPLSGTEVWLHYDPAGKFSYVFNLTNLAIRLETPNMNRDGRYLYMWIEGVYKNESTGLQICKLIYWRKTTYKNAFNSPPIWGIVSGFSASKSTCNRGEKARMCLACLMLFLNLFFIRHLFKKRTGWARYYEIMVRTISIPISMSFKQWW